MSTFGDFAGKKIVDYLEHYDKSLQQLLTKKGYVFVSCRRNAKNCSKYYIKTNDFLQRLPLAGFNCVYCGLYCCDNCSKKCTFMNLCISCSFKCSSFNIPQNNIPPIIPQNNNHGNGRSGYFPINKMFANTNDIECAECNSTEHVKLFQISPEPGITITILMCSLCRLLV